MHVIEMLSIGGIFFYRTLCMLHETRRIAEHSVTLQQRFPPLCTRLLFVVNTLKVFLSFCYIECELFAVFIKILFDNWRHSFPSFCHSCACEMSPGWGHFITWMDPSVGHLNGILARVGGNLNNYFQKSQMPGGLPGGGMLKLRFDRYIIREF